LDFKAFTLKSNNGYIRVLKTPILIRPAKILIDTYNVKYQELEINAIWDTGASRTVICEKIANKLSLISTTKTKVQTANGERISNVYTVDILLPNKISIEDIEVTDMPDIMGGEMLIGMDVINIGDFTITNADKKTVFSFRIPPNYKHIDYVADAKKIMDKRKRRHSHRKK